MLDFTTALKTKMLLADGSMGALLAKMRVVSQQFDVLFTADLYFKIGRQAVELALEMKKAFVEKGYELHMDSPTNQQFFIMSKARAEATITASGYASRKSSVSTNHSFSGELPKTDARVTGASTPTNLIPGPK